MSTPQQTSSAGSQAETQKPNGNPQETMSASLEADIAQLKQLVSQELPEGDDDVDIAELLARLENADGMAQGMESRLDGIIGNLDQLLSALESEPRTDTTEAGKPDVKGQVPEEQKP